MRFNCGPACKPLTERQLRSLDRWRASGQRWLNARKHLTEWHPWFAWYPARVSDGDCRWLEWIERRIEYYGPPAPMVRSRQYRAPREYFDKNISPPADPGTDPPKAG